MGGIGRKKPPVNPSSSCGCALGKDTHTQTQTHTHTHNLLSRQDRPAPPGPSPGSPVLPPARITARVPKTSHSGRRGCLIGRRGLPDNGRAWIEIRCLLAATWRKKRLQVPPVPPSAPPSARLPGLSVG